jgi:hypothetical protein
MRRRCNPLPDRPSARTAPASAGLADYYTIGVRRRAAWCYTNAWTEAERVRNLVSFEPDEIDVHLDGEQLHLEPGQTVVAHGLDRGLDADEILRDPASRHGR